jgi:hypothetical protein
LDRSALDAVHNLPEVARLDKATIDSAFQGLGPAVQTQLQEVDSLHDRLKSKLAGLPDESRRKVLGSFLVALARTGPQREAVEARVASDRMENLLGEKGLFERVFQAVKRPTSILGPDPADPKASRILDPFEWALLDIPADKIRDGKPREAAATRRVIAHLLFNAPADEESPQRAIVVVGLKEYAAVGDSQAQALGEGPTGATTRIREMMDADRAAFIARDIEVVKQLQVLEQRLADGQAELARVKDVQAKNQALVQARQSDVSALQARLAKARTDTKNALAALAAEQKLLFDAQRAVGQGQRANEKLERELHTSEQQGR